MNTENRERQKYEHMWSHYPPYRLWYESEKLVPDFLSHVKAGQTINDYGCGPGRTSLMMKEAGHKIVMIDIAHNSLDEHVRARLGDDFRFIVAPLWDMPDVPRSNWGFCCDVMEHIPEEKVEAALGEIAKKSSNLFFQIATFRDSTGPHVLGEHLHCTVYPAEWWEKRLRKFWQNVSPLLETDRECQFLCRLLTII